jgi:hypothetical protein
MAEVPASSPNIPAAHLVGALASSTTYALLLSTKEGKRWADEQTWSTVVAGVALTLAWFGTWRPRGAAWCLLFFVVTGIPQVVRSLALQLNQLDRLFDREIAR